MQGPTWQPDGCDFARFAQSPPQCAITQVPADMRVAALKTATLRAEQSSLTGEPVAVLKGTEPVHDVEVELQAKECMLFASTTIANGHASAIVTGTFVRGEVHA